METKNVSYAANLEKKLILQFKELFYSKLGYYPIVITQVEEDPTRLPRIPLEQLKEFFTPYLPYLRLGGYKAQKFSTRKLSLDTFNRQRPIVELRCMYCYMARSMGYSLSEIARSINRDHTTVIHNISTFKNLMETIDYFPVEYTKIFKDIRNQLTPSKYEPSTMEHTSKEQSESKPVIFS